MMEIFKKSELQYNKIQKISDARGERRACTVIALSIAGRVPYDVAHRALAAQGRRSGRGIHRAKIVAAFESLGLQMQHSQPIQKTAANTPLKQLAIF